MANCVTWRVWITGGGTLDVANMIDHIDRQTQAVNNIASTALITADAW